MEYTYLNDFKSRDDLKKYNDNALLLYAAQLRFDIDDIDSFASESLTDGYEDKKCDLIYINEDEGIAVISQAYMKQNVNPNERAKLNKASDLNTAAAWIFGRDLSAIPDIIRSSVFALQKAITDNKLSTIYFWYSHNCDESEEIEEELKTVEISAKTLLDRFSPHNRINVYASEIGNKTLERWYLKTTNKILVNDTINIPLVYGGFEIKGEKWKAFQSYIQGKQLFNLFNDHGDDLFSANPRRFLGVGKRTNVINMGIKDSAESTPGDFWVYNNGITALVHSYKAENEVLEIKGISIINGAQTTGTLGSLNIIPDDSLYVPLRVVVCSDDKTIDLIIENNNKQNDMIPSDFRSNDECQSRLRDEFQTYPNIYYSGGLRNNLRPRNRNVFDPNVVAQILVAYVGNPVDAYSNMKKIWIDDKLYSSVFNDSLKPEHIIFVYSLSNAINSTKIFLKKKMLEGTILENEEKQLEFLTKRGTRILLLSTIAKNLEIFTQRRISNPSKLRFKNNNDFDTCMDLWKPLVIITLSFNSHMESALSTGGLDSKERANKVISEVGSLLNAAISYSINPQIKQFIENVIFE